MNQPSAPHYSEPAPPAEPRRLRGWNFWPFVPFLVIGAAVIPNTFKILNATRNPAHSVQDQPWEASKDFDDERAARLGFADAGLTMRAESTADGAYLLRLLAPRDFDRSRLSDLSVACYRPDQPQLDRDLIWRQGHSVLDLSDLPAGAWVFTVSGQLDGADIRHTLRGHAQ